MTNYSELRIAGTTSADATPDADIEVNAAAPRPVHVLQ